MIAMPDGTSLVLLQASPPLTVFGQYVLNGLAYGSIYALVALGLVLIYKASDIVNFANGEMAMFSTFIAFTLLDRLGWSFWAAFAGALVFAMLFGAGVERALIRPLRNAPVLSPVMVTIGLGTLLVGLAGWIWDYEAKDFPTPASGSPFKFGGLVLSQTNAVIIGIAVVLALILFLFFRFTLTGTALRAMAQNAYAARLMGINVGRLMTLTWAIATLLGAVAGMLIAPITFLDPSVMTPVAIKAFAAAVLGGFTSLPGAVIGGISLGIIDQLVGGYLNTELKPTFAFLIIIAILVLRPNGLLGRAVAKKV